MAWADHKPSTRERAARPAPDPSKIIQPGKASSAAGGAGAGAGGDDDPNAIRTLVLSELPEVDKGTLWKRVRKVNDAIQLVYPVEGQDKMAHLIFPSHGDALKGLPKLQGHTYKGAVISAVLKKRMDKMDASGKAASHAGRLIVRNLPWDVSTLHYCCRLPISTIPVLIRSYGLTCRLGKTTSNPPSCHTVPSAKSSSPQSPPSCHRAMANPLLPDYVALHSSGSSRRAMPKRPLRGSMVNPSRGRRARRGSRQ